MRIDIKRLLIMTSLLLPAAVPGCASVISRDILASVDRSVTPGLVQSNPEAYKDARVVWGGIILKVENLKETTIIEVFATELSIDDRPQRTVSGGAVGTLGGTGARFLVEAPGYLDPVIYKPDTSITVAGTVKGIKKKTIGEMEYPYPVLAPLELRIFGLRAEVEYQEPMMLPFWYYPPPYTPYNPYWPYYQPYYPYYP